MSSENMVENEIDTSSPRIESNHRSVDGDSSKETPARATDLASTAKTGSEHQRGY